MKLLLGVSGLNGRLGVPALKHAVEDSSLGVGKTVEDSSLRVVKTFGGGLKSRSS